MNMEWVDERYQLKQQLMQAEEGTWYRAIDVALKREILILIMTKQEHQVWQEAQRELKDITELSADDFLHILNAGETDEYSYVIFQSYSGEPLFQYAQHHAASSRTVLNWVFRAGQLLQEGQRLGLPDFSVSYDNLWLTEDNELIVMNYWKEARSARTGTFGLSQLLYQCCTLHALAPRQADIYISRIQSALKHEQPALRESIQTLTKRIYEDEPSMMSFMVMLKEMIDQPSIPMKAEKPQPTESIKQLDAMDDTMLFAPIGANQAGNSRTMSENNLDIPVAEGGYRTANLDELMTAPKPNNRERMSAAAAPPASSSNRRPSQQREPEPEVSSKRTPKMKIISIIAGCVLFFGLVGVAVLWANSLSSDRDTTADSSVNTTLPTEQNPNQTPSSPEAGAEDEPNVDVPDIDNEPQDDVSNSGNGSSGNSDSNSDNNSNSGSTTEKPNVNDKPKPAPGNDSNTSSKPNTGDNSNIGNGSPDQPSTPETEGPIGPITPEGGEPTEPPITAPDQNGGEATPEGTAPNLVGLTQDAAEKQILAAGLKYTFVKENAEGQEAGKVFKQEPTAGTAVKKGDRITFYIARGTN